MARRDTYFFTDCVQHGNSQFDANTGSRIKALFRQVSRNITPDQDPPHLETLGVWRGADLGFLLAEMCLQETGLVLGGNAAKRQPGKDNGTPFSVAMVGGCTILSTVGENTYPVMARILELNSIDVAVLNIVEAARRMGFDQGEVEEMTATQFRSLRFQTPALAYLASLDANHTRADGPLGGQIKTFEPDPTIRIIHVDSFGNLKLSGRKSDLPDGGRVLISFPEHMTLSALGANNKTHITEGTEGHLQVASGSSVPSEQGGLLELQILGGIRLGVDSAADKLLGHFQGVPGMKCIHDLIGVEVEFTSA